MRPKFAKVIAGVVLFVSGAVVGVVGSRLLGEQGLDLRLVREDRGRTIRRSDADGLGRRGPEAPDRLSFLSGA